MYLLDCDFVHVKCYCRYECIEFLTLENICVLNINIIKLNYYCSMVLLVFLIIFLNIIICVHHKY